MSSPHGPSYPATANLIAGAGNMLARPYWAWSKLALAVLLALSVYCRRLQPHELLNDSQLPGGMQHSRAGGGAAAGGGSDQLSGRRQLGDGAGHAGAVEGAVLTAAAAGANDPHTAAVMAGAGVHGFVRKAGPLDPLHWQAGSFDWRVLQRQSWLDERARLLAEGGWAACPLVCAAGGAGRWQASELRRVVAPLRAGSPPPPLPLLSSCQVFVNHLYRVIYLRHAKTASSSLLCHFSGCREEKAGGGSGKADTSFQHLKVHAAGVGEERWRRVVWGVRWWWAAPAPPPCAGWATLGARLPGIAARHAPAIHVPAPPPARRTPRPGPAPPHPPRSWRPARSWRHCGGTTW